MKTLKNLFLEKLAEMYAAEQELAKTLAKLTRLAQSDELREVLKAHSFETVQQISKVALIFARVGEVTTCAKGGATVVLMAEADLLVAAKNTPCDAAIVTLVQKIKLYETRNYDCLRDWALALGYRDAMALLAEILEEERSTDEKVTELGHRLHLDSFVEQEWQEDADTEREIYVGSVGRAHARA